MKLEKFHNMESSGLKCLTSVNSCFESVSITVTAKKHKKSDLKYQRIPVFCFGRITTKPITTSNWVYLDFHKFTSRALGDPLPNCQFCYVCLGFQTNLGTLGDLLSGWDENKVWKFTNIFRFQSISLSLFLFVICDMMEACSYCLETLILLIMVFRSIVNFLYQMSFITNQTLTYSFFWSSIFIHTFQGGRGG